MFQRESVIFRLKYFKIAYDGYMHIIIVVICVDGSLLFNFVTQRDYKP
jgi:hypothetical protein